MFRKKKSLIALIVIPLLASSFLASGAKASSSVKKVRIGVIYLDTQGFYGGVKKGIVDGGNAASEKVVLLENNALDDPTKESVFFSTLIAQKVQAILVSASSATASVPAFKAAAAAKIPVICYNTCIGKANLSKYVAAYALGDPVAFGYKLGVAAANYFTTSGIATPKIAVVNCEFVEVCVFRRAGFEKALKAKVPGYTIVANQKGGDSSASLTAAQDMLTANPNINAFFGEYGDATVGAIKAVQNASQTGKIVVFGGDMTAPLANYLIDNKILKAEVDISGQTMGKTAIKAAINAINGKKVKNVIIPVHVDLYTTPASASGWLVAHADGIP